MLGNQVGNDDLIETRRGTYGMKMSLVLGFGPVVLSSMVRLRVEDVCYVVALELVGWGRHFLV